MPIFLPKLVAVPLPPQCMERMVPQICEDREIAIGGRWQIAQDAVAALLNKRIPALFPDPMDCFIKLPDFFRAIFEVMQLHAGFPLDGPMGVIYPASGGNLFAMMHATDALAPNRPHWYGVMVSDQPLIGKSPLEDVEMRTDVYARQVLSRDSFVNASILETGFFGIGEILLPICIEATLLKATKCSVYETEDPFTWGIRLWWDTNEIISSRIVYYTQHIMTEESLFPSWVYSYLDTVNIGLLKAPVNCHRGGTEFPFPTQAFLKALPVGAFLVAGNFPGFHAEGSATSQKLQAFRKAGFQWGGGNYAIDGPPVFLVRKFE